MLAYLPRRTAWFLCACLSLFPVSLQAESLDQTGHLWGPALEWSLEHEWTDGNPFDLEAHVTFVHRESGERRRTGMFHDRDTTWKFRFTGVKEGEWTLETSSDVADLDGHAGTITVLPALESRARGFLVAEQNHWKWSGSGEIIVPQIVMYRDPDGYSERPERIDADLALWFGEHGFHGLHTSVLCRWFDLDKTNHGQFDDDDPNPDPRTFAALELLIDKAHAAGGFVHLWAWGDEDRRMTPIRWGINGKADRRLQRYLAARLGPLPGWTMGYGFDLWEWVGEEQLLAWHGYLHEQLGWPHLIGGRVHQHGTPLTAIMTGELDYIGYETHRPDYAAYVEARRLHPERPIMMEDRFRVRTDSRWPEKDYDLTLTRRGMWHSAMAGGVANIWGYLVPDSESDGMSRPYPNREQLLAHAQFFRGRLVPGMAPANDRTDGQCLASPKGAKYLFYREDAESIRLGLAEMSSARPAFAIDARKPYREIDLGELEPGDNLWQAPYRSDWAIAVGYPPSR